MYKTIRYLSLFVFILILITGCGIKRERPDDVKLIKNVVGKFPRLHIKYSDRPFDWLYTATPRQITEFAKSMYEDAWGLRWRIRERVDELMKKESA